MAKMSFGEQQYASRFRDLVTRIARKVVEEERPAERIGQIVTWDGIGGTCKVIFPGDSVEDAVTVKCAQNMQASRGINSRVSGRSYVGNAVRVAGRPGHYYISGYVSGGPGSVLPGHVMLWPHSSPPYGWIICDGAQLSAHEYPELYEAIGNVYGGTTENFNIPSLSAAGLDTFPGGAPHTVFVIKT